MFPEIVQKDSIASSVAPRFWHGSTEGTDKDKKLVNYLAHYMNQHDLCRSMLQLSLQDCSSWLQPWQPMSPFEKPSACNLADRLFGNLSLPYPEMSLTSVGIVFHRAKSSKGPVFARIHLELTLRNSVVFAFTVKMASWLSMRLTQTKRSNHRAGFK